MVGETEPMAAFGARDRDVIATGGFSRGDRAPGGRCGRVGRCLCALDCPAEGEQTADVDRTLSAPF